MSVERVKGHVEEHVEEHELRRHKGYNDLRNPTRDRYYMSGARNSGSTISGRSPTGSARMSGRDKLTSTTRDGSSASRKSSQSFSQHVGQKRMATDEYYKLGAPKAGSTKSGRSSTDSARMSELKRADRTTSLVSTGSSKYSPQSPQSIISEESTGSENPQPKVHSTRATSAAPGPQQVTPRARRKKSVESIDGGVRLSSTATVEGLRREGSKRQDPVARAVSNGSHSSAYPIRNPPISLERENTIRSSHSGLHAVDDSSTDSSVSSISSYGHGVRNKIFGPKTKRKGGLSDTDGKKKKKNDKRERIKERVMENVKSVVGIIKPIAHDTIELGAAYGRMVPHISMFLAPAAIIALWAWDSLQYVQTNQDTCERLLEQAAEQHQKLIELIQKCSIVADDISEIYMDFLMVALDKHKEACHAVYDSVLEQKNEPYLKRFAKRREIGEDKLGGAKTKLEHAKSAYTEPLTTMTWFLTVSNHQDFKEIRQDLSRYKEQNEALQNLKNQKNEIEKEKKMLENQSQSHGLKEEEKEKLKYLRLKSDLIEEIQGKEIPGPTGHLLSRIPSEEEPETRTGNRPQAENTPRTQAENTPRTQAENTPRTQAENTPRTQVENTPRTEVENTPRTENRPQAENKLQTENNPHSSSTSDELVMPVRNRLSDKKTGSKAKGKKRELIVDSSIHTDMFRHRYASLYQSKLQHSHPVVLKQALWTPTVVEVGFVGFIDETHGEFKLLLDAKSGIANHRRRHRALDKLDKFPPDCKIEENRVQARTANGQDSRTRVTNRIRKPQSTKDLADKYGHPIKKTHRMLNSTADERAFLVVDDKSSYYIHYSDKDLRLIKKWFNASIDNIATAYGMTNDKIILVTGTLTTRNWGLLISRKEIEQQIHFCEFAGVDNGDSWGDYSIGAVTNLEPDEDYVSKVSQYDPERKKERYHTVLLSRLHFPIKGGSPATICTLE